MADINISSTNSSDIFGKLFLFSIIFLLLGVGVGVVVDKMLLPSKTTTPVNSKNAANLPKPEGVTAENVGKTCANYLADPTKIMTSPVFTEWLGSVEGQVVEKTSDSFTLEKEGSKLKIYLHNFFTGFVGENIVAGKREKLNFDQIPLGTYLRGGVTISRGSNTGKADQKVVANVFTIINGTKK